MTYSPARKILTESDIHRIGQLATYLDEMQRALRGAHHLEDRLDLMGIAGELRKIVDLPWHPRALWPELSVNSEPVADTRLPTREPPVL